MFENYLDLSLIIPILIALLGWLITHRFTSNRELLNKQREIKTTYLIEAYRKLESSTNPNNPKETWNDIKSAICDIQLLGTPKQVKLAKEFAEHMGKNDNASTMELLVDLRETLRKELSLEAVNEKILFLRFEVKKT